MKNPTKLWKDLVYRFAEQSKCKSRQVGAVVVKGGRLVAQGWNSAPKGSNTDQCTRAKCCGLEQASGANLSEAICCHAEANAIANCSKEGISTDGAALYCTTFPCPECAKLIVGSGIDYICYDQDYGQSELAFKILTSGRVTITRFKDIEKQ